MSVCLVGSVVFLCDLILRNMCDSIWWTPALIIVTCMLKVKSSIVEVAQLLTFGNVASLLQARGSWLRHRLNIMWVYLRSCNVWCGQLSCFYVATILVAEVFVSVAMLGYMCT